MGSIIHILLQSPVSDVETRAVSRLRVIFAAGIGRKVDVALKRWPDVQLIDGYGLSESPGTIAFDDSFAQTEPYPCIGRPVSSVSMKIVDPNTGRECAVRETGEITIDIENGFAGYLNNADANSEAIRGGIFHTGDLAYRDEAGRFYFVSRIKDIIRRGGQNIAAGEVEQVVLQHPAVAEVAAVPMPDPVLEERVAVFCVLKDPTLTLSLSELRAFCEGRLATYRIPEHLEVVAVNDIPRTATGKLAKFQLRQQLAKAVQVADQA
jgi:acyl-CoA synthetase (AMP-forming)/AMP-acid ligase II